MVVALLHLHLVLALYLAVREQHVLHLGDLVQKTRY